MKKKILWSLAGMLIVFQFVRPSRNEGNSYGPEDFMHVLPVSAEVKQVLENSCFDCHSNHTNYPWYTNIQPIGLWMQHHVNDGREELNFSEFAAYSAKRKKHKLEEIAEMVEEHEMPLPSYLWIHKHAALSETQAKLLIDWAKGNLATPGVPAEHHDDE